MHNKVITWTAVALGVMSFANGVFMTIAPEPWYWTIPGVPDRGPYNQHFVRDIGIAYMFIGVGFVCGALYIKHQIALWSMPTAWLTGHALFHIWEVLVGICGPEALVVDFGGVTFPSLLGLGLIYTSYRTQLAGQVL
jgi:hypothetical protein